MEFFILDPVTILSLPYQELAIFFFLHIFITISIGFIIIPQLHEYFHYRKAIKLGYEVTNFKFWKHEIEVEPNTKEDALSMAYAPYIPLITLSIILMISGILLSTLGLMLGGACGLLTHMSHFVVEKRETLEEIKDLP